MNVQSASVACWLMVVLPPTMMRAADVQKDDVTRVVREQVYVLRQHRVFCRNDEWAAAIRELVQIGKPAVPELVAELDRTNRDETLRALGFTLRAINDPRAVPALIRAIPKLLRGAGSDCGVSVHDADLWAFMKQHERNPDDDDSVGYGRPVNEILSALSKITGHHEPPEGERDKLRHVFRGGTEEQRAAKRRTFRERMEHWEQWWAEHREDFVSQEELLSVEIGKRDRDLVHEAGLARFGPLFPTGDSVRLGPIREVQLEPSSYWDAKSHIDFDLGRVFEQFEGSQEAASDGFARWYVRNGIDIRGIDGKDLHTWLIPNSRWESLEEEIRSGKPIELGREARSTLVPFGKSRRDYRRDQVGTFLFTTREGGRGVVQVFPRTEGSEAHRLRYRMWVDPDVKQAIQPALPPRKQANVALGPLVEPTLQTPARGKIFLLDLETGRTVAPPDSLVPVGKYAFYKDKEFVTWCREQGIDVVTNESRVGFLGGAPSDRASRPSKIVQLIGLDMVARRVLPRSFDEMSVEKIKEILDRWPVEKAERAWMSPQTGTEDQPDTFVIKTRNGNVGLLQIVRTSSLLQFAMIRYRISGNAPVPSKQ